MRFEEKYPDVKADDLMPELEGRLIKTGRHYSCDTGMGGCGAITDWRDISYGGCAVPVCSEECLRDMDAQLERVLIGTELRSPPAAVEAVPEALAAQEPGEAPAAAPGAVPGDDAGPAQ